MAEGLEKRGIRRAGESQMMGATPDFHGIAGNEFGLHLAVGGQFDLNAGGCDSDSDCGFQVQDERSVGESVGADGGEGKDLGVGGHERSARCQGVGRGSGRRADDQPIAPITRQDFTIHFHIQLDEAHSCSATDHEVVEGQLAGVWRRGVEGGLNEAAALAGGLVVVGDGPAKAGIEAH